MKNDKKATFVLRERVLELLTDAETSKVSRAETVRLDAGDEYLDLEALSRGVLKADGKASEMKHALPKKAVEQKTWVSILAMLSKHPAHHEVQR